MTTANTTEPRRDSDTVHGLVRLRIEVVGEDRDACRRLLRDLCDMIDAGLAVAPSYSVSKIDGSASCDVNTISPLPPACPECQRVTVPTPKGHTCTACGHWFAESNTGVRGGGTASGTPYPEQPCSGDLNTKGE